jgi:hypothetical protein
MGFMDKAKEAALKGKAQAQQLAQQSQAKVAEMKESREEGELFKSLGEAYYGQQRKGGDATSVTAALAALDAHFAANPPAAPAAEAPAAGLTPASGPTPATGAAPATGQAPPAAPSGDYTLDDV